MTKIYRLHPKIILIPAGIIVFAILIMVFFGSSVIISGVCTGVIITLLFSTIGIYGVLGKVRIDSEGITVGSKLYLDFTKSLKWNQIESIRYKPTLFLKSVRIYPLGSKWARLSGAITISNLIRNYPQLLHEIIMNTYDKTKVDPEVVKLAGMVQEELGNRKSTTLVRIIEQ